MLLTAMNTGMKGKPTISTSLLTMSVAVTHNCFFRRKLFFTAKNCPKYPIPWVVFRQLQVDVWKPRLSWSTWKKKKSAGWSLNNKAPQRIHWSFTGISPHVLSQCFPLKNGNQYIYLIYPPGCLEYHIMQ